MANRQVTTQYSEQAIIDTAPSTGGYWSNGVLLIRSGSNIDKLLFTVRGTGTAVPVLQFRDTLSDDDWTDYYNQGTAFVVGDVFEIDAKMAQIEWRVGVKEGGYTSGEIAVGLNWSL